MERATENSTLGGFRSQPLGAFGPLPWALTPDPDRSQAPAPRPVLREGGLPAKLPRPGGAGFFTSLVSTLFTGFQSKRLPECELGSLSVKQSHTHSQPPFPQQASGNFH